MVDLVGLQQLDPAFLRVNPNGMVPALVVQGTSITEASIINEYLEERFPEAPLLPRDPLLRARIRVWTKYIDTSPTVKIALPTFKAWVTPALSGQPREPLLARVGTAPDEINRDRWQRAVEGRISDDDVAGAYRVIDDMLARMEARLAEAPWLFGESYTLADVETIPLVMRVLHLERADLLAPRPRVTAWLDRARAQPNFAPTYARLEQAARS
jgi:glutathione S-transferase